MRNRALTLFTASLFVLGPLASCAPTPPHEATLGDQLRKGGYVIFFRHGATEDTNDADTSNLADCSKQRNLNEPGRAQARRIGAAFREAQIPVGEVLSSEFCRCIETAQLAFGRATPEPVLTSYLRKPEHERPQAIEALKQILSQTPKPGTNTIAIGHHNMFRDAAHIVLEEGEGIVLQPLGHGEFRVIAQEKPDYWEKML